MEHRLVVAMVELSCVDAVDEAIRALGATGVCTAPVAGVGGYSNAFPRNTNVRRARIEICTTADRAQVVAKAVAQAARGGTSDDHIVAILPVERV